MKLEEFVKALEEAIKRKKVVIFSGAGLSTASGIKDFRGKNGLYKENIDAETILSRDYFIEHPEEFYKFFRENLINDGVKPNLMHEVIADMQKEGIISGIITQNIDGLDIEAGSKGVIEIHGSANRFSCMECREHYSLEDIKSMDLLPRCKCGGIIRPDIVLYGEPLVDAFVWEAQREVASANTMIVLGSSLVVDPAAKLVKSFIVDRQKNEDKKLFIINQGQTYYDYFADYRYDGDMINVAKKIKRIIKKN